MVPPNVKGRAAGKQTRPLRSSEDLAASYNDDIAEQLRRRREAASRLPPLASGKWDPWDLETYCEPARDGMWPDG